MKKIPIVISSDNNIFFTVGVVLVSLLENAASETFYEINCLCTGDVTDENKAKLNELRNNYANFSLKFFDMKDKFKDIPSTEGYHVNYVSAYKMLIPSMFPEYSKVLYLDTDILVRDDLTEFYDFPIGDNYLAGTPVYGNSIGQYQHFIDLLELPNMDYYINAGVMLMNLDKIREDNIQDKWISMLGAYKGSVDQHILNKVCFGKTTYVPQKFNVCITEFEYLKSGEACNYYSPAEVQDAFNNPVIFHWAGTSKPWKYYDTFLAQEWLKYFNKTAFVNILTRDRCKILTRDRCNNSTPQVIQKKIFYFLGIPILKIKYCGEKKKMYLFGILRIFTEKNWKGNAR